MNSSKEPIRIYAISLVPSSGEGGSGGDTRFFEIVKYFQKLKHVELSIVTTRGGLRLSENFGLRGTFHQVKSLLTHSPLLNNIFLILSSIGCIKIIKRNEKIIVYNSSDHLYDAIPCALAVIFKKAKWAAVVHWVEDFPWKNGRGDTPILHRYTYWLQRVATRSLVRYFADLILAVSPTTAEKISKKIVGRSVPIIAVDCGINFDQLIKNRFRKKNYSYDGIYIKRLSPGKGVNDLIPIWKIVIQKYPNAKLAVIGDGHPGVIQKIKNEIATEGLQDNVDLLGAISDRYRIFELIASSRVFILPTYEENWAIVIGESLASETPVVAYNLVELTEIWGNSVTWSETGDTNDFGKKVIHLMSNDSEYDKMLSLGFDFVQKFSWESIAKKEISYMYEMISNEK